MAIVHYFYVVQSRAVVILAEQIENSHHVFAPEIISTFSMTALRLAWSLCPLIHENDYIEFLKVG